MQHVMSVLWSMDNKYVLSGSDEFNIRLWKAYASEKLGPVCFNHKIYRIFFYLFSCDLVKKPHLNTMNVYATLINITQKLAESCDTVNYLSEFTMQAIKSEQFKLLNVARSSIVSHKQRLVRKTFAKTEFAS